MSRINVAYLPCSQRSGKAGGPYALSMP